MPRLTLVTGILLILLGIISYFATGQASLTALIPTAFGIVFAILSWLSRKENLRKHIMHAAAALALLGLIGSFGGLISAFTLIFGGQVERPAATVAQAIMALLLIRFLIYAVKSFIDARKSTK